MLRQGSLRVVRHRKMTHKFLRDTSLRTDGPLAECLKVLDLKNSQQSAVALVQLMLLLPSEWPDQTYQAWKKCKRTFGVRPL